MTPLPASINMQSAPSVADQLVLSLQSQSSTVWTIDAGTLRQFDSCALSVLLEVKRKAKARNVAFKVENLPEKLLSLSGVYGVTELLT